MGERKIRLAGTTSPPFLVATVSFVISAFTFYTSSLQQVDELSVIVGRNGSFSYSGATEQNSPVVISVLAGDGLVFINGGNRPISVLDFKLIVRSSGSEESDNETSNACFFSAPINLLQTAFDPIVVKAGEILTKRLQFKNAEAVADSIVVPEHVMQGKAEALTSCAMIGFATPDSGYKLKFLSLDKAFKTGGLPLGEIMRFLEKERSPLAIVRRSRTTVGWLNKAIDWASPH